MRYFNGKKYILYTHYKNTIVLYTIIYIVFICTLNLYKFDFAFYKQKRFLKAKASIKTYCDTIFRYDRT